MIKGWEKKESSALFFKALKPLGEEGRVILQRLFGWHGGWRHAKDLRPSSESDGERGRKDGERSAFAGESSISARVSITG